MTVFWTVTCTGDGCEVCDRAVRSAASMDVTALVNEDWVDMEGPRGPEEPEKDAPTATTEVAMPLRGDV